MKKQHPSVTVFGKNAHGYDPKLNKLHVNPDIIACEVKQVRETTKQYVSGLPSYSQLYKQVLLDLEIQLLSTQLRNAMMHNPDGVGSIAVSTISAKPKKGKEYSYPKVTALINVPTTQDSSKVIKILNTDHFPRQLEDLNADGQVSVDISHNADILILHLNKDTLKLESLADVQVLSFSATMAQRPQNNPCPPSDSKLNRINHI